MKHIHFIFLADLFLERPKQNKNMLFAFEFGADPLGCNLN